MNDIEWIDGYFRNAAEVIASSGQALAEPLARAREALCRALGNDGGVLVFGNGGSAADAQHIAAEMVGRFAFDRPGLRAVALSTDSSILTSVANDYGFEQVFARQVQALGRKGDVAIGLSTSGNSPNVLAGLEAARANGLVTVAMTGRGGGQCGEVADILLAVPHEKTARIQEAHAVAYHLLCEAVEKQLFGRGG